MIGAPGKFAVAWGLRAAAAAGACAFFVFSAAAEMPAREKVTQEPMPPGIHLEYSDTGFVYANAEGKTIYIWRGDSRPGKSLCNNEHISTVVGGGEVKYTLPDADKRPTCQDIWHPVLAPEGAKPTGKWSTLIREDGTKQWVYGRQPLYTWVFDRGPGDTTGNGFRVPLRAEVYLPPSVVVVDTSLGRVLMTADGWALYHFDRDTPRKTQCTGACAETWTPFAAPEMAQEKGDWTTLRRPEGTKQWLYQGRSMYRYAAEKRPREIAGNKIRDWQPAFVQAAPKPPAGIKTVMTSSGEILADKNGMTLYTFYCTEESPDSLGCDGPGASQVYRLSTCGGPEKCMATYRPLVAEPNAKSGGLTWSVVDMDAKTGALCVSQEQECGLRVWSYQGKPVYTFAGDKKPGDFLGDYVSNIPQLSFSAVRPGRNYFR
jgi:predicted lipoprotein with Yx(FWY)xxD motif